MHLCQVDVPLETAEMKFKGLQGERGSSLCNEDRLISALCGLLAEEPEDSNIKGHTNFWLLQHLHQLQSGNPLLSLSAQQ